MLNSKVKFVLEITPPEGGEIKPKARLHNYTHNRIGQIYKK